MNPPSISFITCMLLSAWYCNLFAWKSQQVAALEPELMGPTRLRVAIKHHVVVSRVIMLVLLQQWLPSPPQCLASKPSLIQIDSWVNTLSKNFFPKSALETGMQLSLCGGCYRFPKASPSDVWWPQLKPKALCRRQLVQLNGRYFKRPDSAMQYFLKTRRPQMLEVDWLYGTRRWRLYRREKATTRMFG